jgi:hypothetical protein
MMKAKNAQDGLAAIAAFRRQVLGLGGSSKDRKLLVPARIGA